MRASKQFARFAVRPDKTPRSRSGWLLALAAVLGAAALAVLSVPRIAAALQAIPAVETLGKLNRVGTLPPDVAELATARQSLALAQHWQNDAALATELARIDLILATRQVQSGQDAKPLLESTIAMARHALHGNPAQARAWQILSEAIFLRDGLADPKLVDYFSQSLEASPYDFSLALNQVWMATLLWDRLEPRTRALAAAQMRVVVQRFKLETLVGIAKQLGNPNPAREALSGDRELRERFEALYLQG